MLKADMEFMLKSVYRKIYLNNKRVQMLECLPKNGVGAEIGVFTGEFSKLLLKCLTPRELYLIDPWWKKHGERFPWVDNSRLTPKKAFELTQRRVRPFMSKTKVEIVVDEALEYANKIPDRYFDWIYLDTSHSLEATREELRVFQSKIKENGYIAGDDWQPDKSHKHHGVYAAVQEFIRKEPFEIIYAGTARQWCLRKV